MAREQMRWWGWAWRWGGEQRKQTEQLHQPPLSYVILGGRCHHGEYPPQPKRVVVWMQAGWSWAQASSRGPGPR